MKKILCVYKDNEEKVDLKCPNCSHGIMVLKEPLEPSDTKEVTCSRCGKSFYINKMLRRKL
jgi:predicted Zn finger-like uncharacterized protein